MAAFFKALEMRVLSDVLLEHPTLDLGCSDGISGKIIGELLGYGSVGTGTDLSFGELYRAKSDGNHNSLVQSNAILLPFMDNSFASVLCTELFQAVPDVNAAVSEAARVLQTGGLFIVSIPTDRFDTGLIPDVFLKAVGLKSASKLYRNRLHRRLGQIHRYPESDWLDILRRNGFQIEKKVPFFSLKERRFWSILALYIMRVFGLLKFLRGTIAGKLAEKIVFLILLPFYKNSDGNAGSDGGYFLIVAKKG
ncbi:MAG: class I SAM-dependent methyltransferase [Candidatus Theseobacter exili]|nr:class I SAM-dependent methyltransferase [Candidatus Theseobacter exili]